MFDIIAVNAPADGSNPFVQIFETFGIHQYFFIAQLINFILVIFVLKTFAFGPIQKMLEQRKNRIAEGEEKLKRIEKQLADSEATTAAALEKANNDAKRLIEEAKESAASITEQKTQEAIVSAQNIISKAKEAAQSEQRDFGRLVTMTTANVTGKVLNDDDKNRINEESLQTING